ncbi:MAG: aminopeptidase P family N-terminal domain-containing protein, partial [Hyphomicrobiaceae bacterium]
MFQSFEAPADASACIARTKLVRDIMRRLKIDAFLVPRADEHQGEYVPPSAERLKWLTGFSGSAGMAVVASTKAVVLVDGRYTLQARAQVPLDTYEIAQVPQAKLADWLTATLRPDAVVGFDPWLHTVAEVDRLQSALKEKGIALKPVTRNPVDDAWGKTRPALPHGQVAVQPLKFAGTAAEDKIGKLQARLVSDGQDAVILTLPDSICWLLNIRGSDIAHNPVVLAFAVVPAKGKPELFIDGAKLDAVAKAHLAGLCKITAPAKLTERLTALKDAGKRVRLDPETAAWAISRRLGGRKKIVEGADPCIAAKAPKTTAEIAGTKSAHLRDGAALARFLCWLDVHAPNGGVDEIAAAQQLESYRADTGELRELSFDTISGAGPNGAIVHYRVTTATNRKLRSGELYLVDSGAQYADGTTDVTRTIAIGKPTEAMR